MKLSPAEVHGIFPTPIYKSKLSRDFSIAEKKEFQKHHDKFSKPNEGNLVGSDSYILNKKPLAKLKKEIQLRIENYFLEVINPINKIKPYITQSWLNWTTNNQFHHMHSHPNSVVSGVLYIDADPNCDKITFYNSKYTQIDFKIKEANLFNSGSWFFPVYSGMLIMFPSHLTHKVEVKESNNLRKSLAFNIFIKGTIGSKEQLTELVLK
jgi:uncharacterized protein (TIGR02466 family)